VALGIVDDVLTSATEVCSGLLRHACATASSLAYICRTGAGRKRTRPSARRLAGSWPTFSPTYALALAQLSKHPPHPTLIFLMAPAVRAFHQSTDMQLGSLFNFPDALATAFNTLVRERVSRWPARASICDGTCDGTMHGGQGHVELGLKLILRVKGHCSPAVLATLQSPEGVPLLALPRLSFSSVTASGSAVAAELQALAELVGPDNPLLSPLVREVRRSLVKV
jgi:hypothetical protein